MPSSNINGVQYEWETSPFEHSIAAAPEWIVKGIHDFKREKIEDDERIPESKRNDTLMRRGVYFRKAGLSHSEIETMLLKINAERCDLPLEEDEVRQIAKSVSKYEKSSKGDPYTDVWNAKIFVEKYNHQIRNCEKLKGWFYWNEKHWKQDEIFHTTKLARDMILDLRNQAIATSDKELLKHSIKCECETKINGMINLSRSFEGISCLENTFDRDDYLLNCGNGTLDLRTFELMPHTKENFITKLTDIPYIPEYQCPEWHRFLNSIFLNDDEIIEFMQKAVGYSLTGSTAQHCLFILYGVGRNGKSSFLKHISNTLGDYAISSSSSLLMLKYSDVIPNDVARLKGARFVSTIEPQKNRPLDESQVKLLTGGDKITARYLHCEYFDFMPTFKIFFACNYKPEIRGTDKGIWRRVRLIPFDLVIEDHKIDYELDDKLSKEYMGILAWGVEGYKK